MKRRNQYQPILPLSDVEKARGKNASAEKVAAIEGETAATAVHSATTHLLRNNGSWRKKTG